MLPIIIAKSSVQINFLINQLLIIGTVSGALATFYYAERMLHLPIGIFIIAITTVLLPDITAHIQNGDKVRCRDAENRAFMGAFVVSFPIMAGFICLGAPIMLTLFQRGAFSVEAAIASAEVLGLLAISIPFIGILKIQTTILFAHGDTKTPMQISIFGALCNIGLAFYYIKLFSFQGAALASSLAIIIQTVLAIFILARRGHYRFDRAILILLLKIMLATLAMVIFLISTLPSLGYFISADFSARLYALSSLIFTGACIYIIAVFGLRIIKISDIRKFIKAK